MMYQGGALWTSMTLAENVALPLAALYRPRRARRRAPSPPTSWRWSASPASRTSCRRRSAAAWPSGRRSRGRWRWIPTILFLDEPSAGLDPVTSHRLDDLILDLRRTLGMSFVIVTHELASIFRVADRVVYLDAATHTMTAIGPPKQLLAESQRRRARGVPQRRRGAARGRSRRHERARQRHRGRRLRPGRDRDRHRDRRRVRQRAAVPETSRAT